MRISTSAAWSSSHSDPTTGNLKRAYDTYGNLTDIGDRTDSLQTEVRTHISYDAAGNVITRIDKAYATSVQRSVQYEWLNGMVPASRTDVDNGLTVWYAYDDIGRQTAVNDAGQRLTVTEYDDANRKVTIRSDLRSYGDGKLESVTHYDQLGRAYLTQTSDGSPITGSSDGIKTAAIYSYPSGGRRVFSTSPYRNVDRSDPGFEWTCTQYDLLGRIIATAAFKGAAQPTSCEQTTNRTGITRMEYDAEWTTVTDPALKARKQRVDGMGRMVEVVEDPGALNYGTTYAYDVTDNLLQVTQGVQNRHYSYSTLGRLLQASNPESGNTNYSYMESGDLLTRTDARNISAAYSYDALQRLLTKDYSDSTPDVTYEYHTSATSTAPDIGNLKSASSSVASAYYVYNSLGNVAASAHGISGYGGDLIFSYDWYLNGALRGMQYPSGREVNYDVDDAGRTNKVYSGALNYADMTAAGINYPFTAGGRVAQMKLGNNLWETMDYQAPGTTTHYRLGTTLGSGNVVEIGYNFWATENNGNVASQVINRPGRTWTQNYTYDNLNRLFTANESGSWSREYGYDRYGNRWVASSQGLAYADSREPTLPSHFSSATNRLTITGAQFDAAGNQTTYPPYDLAYDAENRNIAVTSTGNGNGTFAYDGDGQRVKKVWTPYGGAATTTYYVYDALGKLAAEYSSQAPASSGTSYLFTDMLGSVRTITNSGGTVVENYDYLPFGRMLSSSDYNRANMNFPANPDSWIDSNAPQKFTGKERDETGLDYFLFRNYSGAQGRFLSPDPASFGASSEKPQSWNAYSYVLNNPLRYVDPFGLSEWCYQDGAAVSCDATNTWLTSGAGVEIPADMPLSFYDGKNFQLLIVGAETPLTYASFSALSMLNEWNGHFYIEDGLRNVIAERVKSQKELLAREYSENSGIPYEEVYENLIYVNTVDGNANFTWGGRLNPPKDLVGLSRGRMPGMPSIHLKKQRNTFRLHVDTANPLSMIPLGLIVHGLADCVFGKINGGIPILR